MKIRVVAALLLTLAPTAAAHEPPDATPRFLTDRGGLDLPLPAETDAFTFVVLGDRTGGPAEGIEVLEQAVGEVNLLAPDLVMTVGDLIQGYNTTTPWLRQMREYRRVMDGLDAPWFPVAGNHDVYWRGPGRPPREHEGRYEEHFGPLWYAFRHKSAWFIVLYSDEADPATGIRDFNRPASQRMSPEQFAWLDETLDATAGAPHVFLFLHHPRWLGGKYGDDWTRVHRRLVAAGNVRAVFAGHIHRMRYDGPHDGIEYVTLATTGGGQSGLVPRAGYLHHFHVVTVRPDRLALAALPVGEVLDVRSITGAVADEAARLSRLAPAFEGRIDLAADGSAGGAVVALITNPAAEPIEVTVTTAPGDQRWRVTPDHVHAVLAPGRTRGFRFHAARATAPIDDDFRVPEVRMGLDYLAPGARIPIPEASHRLPVAVDLSSLPAPDGPRVLVLDGVDDALAVPSAAVPLPDGPLTLECWLRAESFAPRTGLVAKTEGSEYGIFVNAGRPEFSVFLGNAYVSAGPADEPLAPDTWHHVAGVYDGREVRLYVNGRRVAAVAGSGARRSNSLPLLVGADVDGRGATVSPFHGAIDDVRLSSAARYTGAAFSPARDLAPDDDTVLLLPMDARAGPFVRDVSGHGAHAEVRGEPRLTAP